MAMSKKDLMQNISVSEKTERERLVIAKEVVIKSLLPVVFGNVKEDKREAVFDKWYEKLLALILDEKAIEKKAVAKAPEKKEAVAPQKKVVNMPSGKITQKQMKMIWAIAHKLQLNKEQLEGMSEEKYGVSRLSSLDKQTASKFIDYLLFMKDQEDLYG